MCAKGKDTTMIKKILILMPLLLLSSCGNKEQVFYNVYYEYDRENFAYNVEIPNGPNDWYRDVKKSNYTVSIDDVYYVYVEQYLCCETCDRLAFNEFHVKGSSYKLVFFEAKKPFYK